MKTATTMTQCPICQMAVDSATALHAERDGKTYYLCCEKCQQKFLALPPGAIPKGKGKAGCCCS